MNKGVTAQSGHWRVIGCIGAAVAGMLWIKHLYIFVPTQVPAIWGHAQINPSNFDVTRTTDDIGPSKYWMDHYDHALGYRDSFIP